jgi:sulfur relay (sulfurtransferase) DsrC/TusE family protein
MEEQKTWKENIISCLNKDWLLDFCTEHWEIIAGVISGYFIAKFVSGYLNG